MWLCLAMSLENRAVRKATLVFRQFTEQALAFQRGLRNAQRECGSKEAQGLGTTRCPLSRGSPLEDGSEE